jgi:hypothetical protein
MINVNGGERSFTTLAAMDFLVVQQLSKAFPYETSPRFLIYDGDSIFSDRVAEWIRNIGIELRRTAFYS